MGRELLFEVQQRVEGMTGIETLLVLPVTSFHFAVVSGRVRTDELMSNSKGLRSRFKQSGAIPLAVGKTVCEFKPVVSLDTFHPDSPAGIPLHQLFQEISRGIGRLFWISGQKTQTGKFVDRGILEQTQLWICNTAAWPPSHLPEPVGRDRSFARRAWLCMCSLAFQQETSPFSA